MFVIALTYKKPIEVVDAYLTQHRDYLESGYQKNYFIASGPKNPRSGGIILSQLKDRDQLQKIIEQDPFYIHEIADFELTEFTPVKYHPNFTPFV